MKFKRILFVSILLLAIFAIGAVSANDEVTSDSQAVSENIGEVFVDERIYESDGVVIKSSGYDNDISGNLTDSQEDVLNAVDDGTFTALQNKINNAKDGSTITLENDYKYDEGFDDVGIEISKPLTINGNGHTINALSKSRIFTISGNDVTLKNIKFENGKAPGGGGAIFLEGNNSKIMDSIFTNNVGSWNGGAIHSSGSDCYIINSIFKNNLAYRHLTGIQIGNSYYSYYVGGYGGAIYAKGTNCNIISSIFTNNTADCYGGAISIHGANGNLSYSNFKDNVAEDGGGAIYWEGDNGEINYCSYTKEDSQGNDLYIFAESVVVNEDSVKINVEDIIKYYGSSIPFIAIVTKDDAPVLGVNVKISANGKTSTVKTDSKGQASINLNLPVGTHEIITEYDDVKVTSKVTVKSTITASDISRTYSNAKATATFLDTAGKALASKQVTFKIGTATYTATTNSNGAATVNIPLSVGTYTVTAVNPTTKEEKQFKLTISKADSNVGLSAVQNGKSVTLTATVTPSGATGKITFVVIPTEVYDSGVTSFLTEQRMDFQSNIVNGKATFTIPDLDIGTYSASTIYDGDSNLMPFISHDTDFKVNKVYSITNVGDTKGTFLDSKVSATFLDNSGKALANTKVTFKAGGKTYSATTNSNGVATAKVDLDAGTYDVTAVNPATKEEKQFRLTIDKANPEFTLETGTFDQIKVNEIDAVAITATFTQNMVTGRVSVSSEGFLTVANNIIDGKAIINTFYSQNVAYNVTVRYEGDKNFNAVEKNFSFKVSDVKPVLSSKSISMVYGNFKNLIINLNDERDGTPIPGKLIHIGIYEKDGLDNYYYFEGYTDNNGQVIISTKGLKPDYYDVFIDCEYRESITVELTIKKATPKLTAAKKTFKKSVKTKKYTVTLKTNLNKVMKNTKVTLKVNGKTYTAKTNSKGQATFKITKLAKKGKFTAAITYKGNSYYNKVTKKVKITVK